MSDNLFDIPKLTPEDLFSTIDQNAVLELSDESLRHMIELVQPIEQMTQRCFTVPTPVELANIDPAKPLERDMSEDWSW